MRPMLLIASLLAVSALPANPVAPIEAPVGVDITALRAQSDTDMQFYNDLAVSFFRQGDHQQARKLLELALQSDPISQQAFKNLQQLYQFLGAVSYAQTQNEALVTRPALTTIAEMRSGILLSGTEVSANDIKPEVESGNTETVAIDPQFQDILNKLNQYFQRWSAGDADSFISFYCLSYEQANRADWEDGRRARIFPSRNIELGIDNLKADWVNDQLQLTFDQRFDSTTYRDHTVKRLLWQQENNRWCIVEDEEIRVISRG